MRTLLIGALLSSSLFGQFYVATTGNDGNAGTIGSPFLTLGRAQTAMRGSGTKTTYIRAGTYFPTASAGSGCDYTDLAAINLTSADSGETWSYYAPDGINSAIIDGSAPPVSQTGPGYSLAGVLDCAFAADQALTVTITGLTFQNWNDGALFVNTNGTTANVVATFTNNIVHDLQTTGFWGGASVQLACPGAGTSVSNNYIYNTAYVGVMLGTGGANCTLNNITIANNFLRNTCTWVNATGPAGGDCGAIYMQVPGTYTPGNASNIFIRNNYIRDVNVASGGRGMFMSCCALGIYLDQPFHNATITGNVVSGIKTSCFLINPFGSGNQIRGNVCDLQTSTEGAQLIFDDESQVSGSNTFTNNVIVAGSEAGSVYSEGFANRAVSPNPIANNAYWNYATSGTLFTNGSSYGDPSPNTMNPLITCWNVVIAGGSPVFSAPVSFPGITGGWGPPGFVIPQTGTAPSWPTAGCGGGCTPGTISPYIQINGSGMWLTSFTAAVAAGNLVDLGPQPLTGTWAWTGPGGFTSALREIDSVPLRTGTNTFSATYMDTGICTTSNDFVLTISQSGPAVY